MTGKEDIISAYTELNLGTMIANSGDDEMREPPSQLNGVNEAEVMEACADILVAGREAIFTGNMAEDAMLLLMMGVFIGLVAGRKDAAKAMEDMRGIDES